MTTLMTAYPDQLVCLLPVDGDLSQDELLAFLPPHHRRREWFTLTKFFPPAVRRQLEPNAAIDWIGLGQALSTMLDAVQTKLDPSRATEYHIVSRAPLSVAMLLGYLLQGFTDKHVFHNRTRSEEWQTFQLGIPSTQAEFFTTRPQTASSSQAAESSPISEASGWVALGISLLGPVERAAMRAALNGELADIVDLSVAIPTKLTPDALRVAVDEIRSALSLIKARYQHAKGIAVFFAGPAPLAFFIGRELNTKAVPNGAARLYDYRATSKSYELAYELPLAPFGAPQISHGDSDRLARRRVFDVVCDELNAFQRHFLPEDLPSPSDREVLAGHIKNLRLPREPSAGETRLTLLQNQLELGDALLEALRVLSEAEQRHVGLLFLIHEVLHFEQNLVHGNFRKVGQAAVALGQIDFIADVFALEASVRWTLRRGGPQAAERLKEITADFLKSYARGVEAFDRLEQGDTIRRLSERRLRRYITWYVQRERSKTLSSLNDLSRLCSTQLVVELAPLKGVLDNQYEKMVEGVLPTSRLVIACDRNLLLIEQGPNFNAAALVDAVRRFRHDEVEPLMRHIVEPRDRRSVLCPWIHPQSKE